MNADASGAKLVGQIAARCLEGSLHRTHDVVVGYDLVGPRGIRVHAISPGPLKTRAAAGLKDFDLLLAQAAERAPLGELVDIMDVGFACAYLATPYARRISGDTVYVDGGVHIMA